MSVLTTTDRPVAPARSVPNADGRRVARRPRNGVGLLFVGGAVLNTALVVNDSSTYAPFADAAHWSFIADTWRSLVAPNAWLFIGLLAAFELTFGITILFGRRWRLGLWAAVAFHVALLLFGWGFWFWSTPMLALLTYLLAQTTASETSRR